MSVIVKCITDDLLEQILKSYIQKTEYASTEKAGCVLLNDGMGLEVDESEGYLKGKTVSYEVYKDTASTALIVSKGTLDRVLEQYGLSREVDEDLDEDSLRAVTNKAITIALAKKQNKLTAGAGVAINPDTGVISASAAGGLYINVANYGTDIAAINAAIADCPRHGTVFIPNLGDGLTYEGTDPIVIDKPMTLMGDSTGWHWTNVNDLEFTNSLITNISEESVEAGISVTSGGVTLRNISIQGENLAVGIKIRPMKYNYEAPTGSPQYQPAMYEVLDNVTVFASNTGKGISIDGAILSELNRCLVYGSAIGYELKSDYSSPTTSVSLINCWANNFFEKGYLFKGVMYSSLVNCACDTSNGFFDSDENPLNPTGYHFSGCKGIDAVSCGCENAVYCALYENSTNCSFSGVVMPHAVKDDKRDDSTKNSIVVQSSSSVRLHDLHYSTANVSMPEGTTYYPAVVQLGSNVVAENTNLPFILDYNAATYLQKPGVFYYTGMTAAAATTTT